jgi:hypothetical protein
MINEQEEERRRLTLEALDDVDAGRVIDHQVGPSLGGRPHGRDEDACGCHLTHRHRNSGAGC